MLHFIHKIPKNQEYLRLIKGIYLPIIHLVQKLIAALTAITEPFKTIHLLLASLNKGYL